MQIWDFWDMDLPFLSKESAFRQHFAVVGLSNKAPDATEPLCFGRRPGGGPGFSPLPVLAALLLL